MELNLFIPKILQNETDKYANAILPCVYYIISGEKENDKKMKKNSFLKSKIRKVR